MSFDPYSVLGVAREAKLAEIKRGYRNMAKQVHPDAGGSEESFRLVQLAFDVLSNPEKRKLYDETGRVEEDKPDLSAIAAGQVIELHMGALFTQYIATFDPMCDPRKFDLLNSVKVKIRQELEVSRKNLDSGHKVVGFYKDMLSRLTMREGTGHRNTVQAMIERQIEHAHTTMAGLREAVVCRELALTMLDDYEFMWEPLTTAIMPPGFVHVMGNRW